MLLLFILVLRHRPHPELEESQVLDGGARGREQAEGRGEAIPVRGRRRARGLTGLTYYRQLSITQTYPSEARQTT